MVQQVTEINREATSGDDASLEAPAPDQDLSAASFGEEVHGDPVPKSVRDKKEAAELAASALDDLNEALREGRSETLEKYLGFLARFHNYSFHNCIMIYLQRPSASMVAGYRRWKELGRHVNEGEKGIAIFAPVTARRKAKTSQKGETVENDQLQEDDEKPAALRTLLGFRVVFVFDRLQTDGADLPEFAKVSGDPGDALSRLERAITQSGMELVYDYPGQSALGTCSEDRITIRPDLDPAERFSVGVHEYAHSKLHFGERRHETTKTVRETEAEAVAFVVCRAFGLDTRTRSADYVQLYRGDVKVLDESLKFIQRTAAGIIEELRAE